MFALIQILRQNRAAANFKEERLPRLTSSGQPINHPMPLVTEVWGANIAWSSIYRFIKPLKYRIACDYEYLPMEAILLQALTCQIFKSQGYVSF